MGNGAGQRELAAPGGVPVVVVHTAAQAALAVRLAGPRGVALLSIPGAAGSLGPAWWRALLAAADAEAGNGESMGPESMGRESMGPESMSAEAMGVLDCADAAGHALAALRAGVRRLVLAGDAPGFAAVAAAAAECGAAVWPARPPAFDCGGLDLRRPGGRQKLADWLAKGG